MTCIGSMPFPQYNCSDIEKQLKESLKQGITKIKLEIPENIDLIEHINSDYKILNISISGDFARFDSKGNLIINSPENTENYYKIKLDYLSYRTNRKFIKVM